jgi:hypothetical protein
MRGTRRWNDGTSVYARSHVTHTTVITANYPCAIEECKNRRNFYDYFQCDIAEITRFALLEVTFQKRTCTPSILQLWRPGLSRP